MPLPTLIAVIQLFQSPNVPVQIPEVKYIKKTNWNIWKRSVSNVSNKRRKSYYPILLFIVVRRPLKVRPLGCISRNKGQKFAGNDLIFYLKTPFRFFGSVLEIQGLLPRGMLLEGTLLISRMGANNSLLSLFIFVGKNRYNFRERK